MGLGELVVDLLELVVGALLGIVYLGIAVISNLLLAGGLALRLDAFGLRGHAVDERLVLVGEARELGGTRDSQVHGRVGARRGRLVGDEEAVLGAGGPKRTRSVLRGDAHGVDDAGDDGVGVAGEQLGALAVVRRVIEVVEAALVGIGQKVSNLLVGEGAVVLEVEAVLDGRTGDVGGREVGKQLALVVGELDVIAVIDLVEQLLRLLLLVLLLVVRGPAALVGAGAEGQGVADALAGGLEVLGRDGHLVGAARQPALHQVGDVHAVLGKGADVHGGQRPVHLGIGGLGVGALGLIHAVECAQRLDVGA